jgi:hypothetical protein
VKWSVVKVLGTSCLTLLEDIQTIWNFIASFIFFWFHFVSFYIGCLFCRLLFIFVYYVFLLLFMFRSRYCVSLCCSVYCFMCMCTVLLPPGDNPIAVNKHINLKFKLVCTAYTIFNDGICGSIFGKVFVFQNMTWPNLTSKYWSGFLIKINFSRSFSEFPSDKFL